MFVGHTTLNYPTQTKTQLPHLVSHCPTSIVTIIADDVVAIYTILGIGTPGERNWVLAVVNQWSI
jgi:hypothetical protein